MRTTNNRKKPAPRKSPRQSRTPVDPQAIEEEVAALGGLHITVLRERWAQLFGAPPPKSLRREFLTKACAYQTQVKEWTPTGFCQVN